MLAPRAVVVHRRTELDELLGRHGTRGQVEFFLATRGRTLAEVQARHEAQRAALAEVRAAIPQDWRRGDVERDELHRFGFGPGDVCLVVGPDGLVANVAKYLDGQPVIGVDPEPGRNAGVLVTHAPGAVAGLLAAVATGRAAVVERTMVAAELDDGQRLDALNEVFVGHQTHQSARYRLEVPGAAGGGDEQQSSSGLIVTTGTGATGWAASLHRERAVAPELPGAVERRLAWFVREAWPSPATGVEHTAGVLDLDDELRVVVASDALVVFGDGLEADRLTATWGQVVTMRVAERVLRLVSGAGT